MPSAIKVGSLVKLLGIPEWLIHDLPESERAEMLGFVGRHAVVTEIDGAGYFWLGFGLTVETGDVADYSGHSFCVTDEFLERVLRTD